jgi:peroxiredoxin
MFLLPLMAPLALAASGQPTLSVGLHALSFSLPAVNEDAAMEAIGRTQVGLGDLVGVEPNHPSKAVVLHFFDREHGGEDLGGLERLQKRYGGRGLQVVAISTDEGDVGAMSSWLEGMKLGYPVLRDNHHVVVDRYGIDKLPLTVVVDRNGYVFAIGQPQGDAIETELQAEIEPLLEK